MYCPTKEAHLLCEMRRHIITQMEEEADFTLLVEQDQWEVNAQHRLKSWPGGSQWSLSHQQGSER